MPMRSRFAFSLICVLAVCACAADEDEPAVDSIVQKLPKCSVTRWFFDVPLRAPAPADTCVLWPPDFSTAKPQQCPPEWKIRPIDITCGNSCSRGAIECTWVDYYGNVHLFNGPLGEPDVEFWTACNNRNSCDGQLPLPGNL